MLQYGVSKKLNKTATQKRPRKGGAEVVPPGNDHISLYPTIPGKLGKSSTQVGADWDPGF